MPGAVYSPLGDRIAQRTGPVYPLHVGDTWRDPFDGGRMQDLTQAAHPGINRYTATRGITALVDAIVEKLRARNGIACERDEVLVTGGATAGLANVVGSIAERGDEVLILAPFWPLIRGIVQSVGATPVEVPFFDRVDGVEAALDAVEARRSGRSVVLYVSTPSNRAVACSRGVPRRSPNGRDAATLAARRRGLRGPRLPRRTRFAGALRARAHASRRSRSEVVRWRATICHLVGSYDVVECAHKPYTHRPTARRRLAVRRAAALQGGGAWLAETREQIAALLRRTCWVCLRRRAPPSCSSTRDRLGERAC
jgi:N-succinyldiaminopimelate aminotransferase